MPRLPKPADPHKPEPAAYAFDPAVGAPRFTCNLRFTNVYFGPHLLSREISQARHVALRSNAAVAHRARSMHPVKGKAYAGDTYERRSFAADPQSVRRH